MWFITGYHVACPVDDCEGEAIVLGPPAHQGVPLVVKGHLVGLFCPPNLFYVLEGLHVRYYGICVPRVKQDLQAFLFKFLEYQH